VGRIVDGIRTRIRYRFHPRALMWRGYQRWRPTAPVIAPLPKGLKARIYPHDVIGTYIFIDGVFERAEWEFADCFLKRGMTVFDLGANLGQYTLLAAASVGPAGRVHSFEPNGRMFSELLFNVDLNGLTAVCVLNRVAVSHTCGTARLSCYAPGGEVYSSLGTRQVASEARPMGYEEVVTTTLDAYIREQGIEHVDFMKIDIEGAEFWALQGARGLLSRRDAPLILVELADVNTEGFGYRAVETWDFLVDLGYQMYALESAGCGLRRMERPQDFSIAANVVAMKH
jgi:FkbM family methyltransferase